VRPNSVPGPAPSDSQGMSVRTPYQLHHGDADVVVSIESDRRLSNLLQASGVAHELFEYPGAEHNEVSTNSTVLARIRTWYSTHGLF
jgi:predicted esterase